MTKALFVIGLLFSAVHTYAQKNKKQLIGIGLKEVYNFARVTGASSVNSANIDGFHLGVFYSPGISKGFGYCKEIISSKQGYDFANENITGSVNLDYILLPQLTTFNIKYILDINFKGQFPDVTAEQKKDAGILLAHIIMDRLKYLWVNR